MTMLEELSPNLVVIPVGYGAGVNAGYSSGVSMAFSYVDVDQLIHKDERDLKWSFAGRVSVHESRRAMSNAFSPNWSPHERHVDLSGVFAQGPLTPLQVADSYSRALFVPSPPGNSPDCFRHYEATIRGAVPIIEGRPTDYAWWLAYYSKTGTCHGIGPFPAPLGWMFPGDPTSNGEETEEVRDIRDRTGFELDGFTLNRRDMLDKKERLSALEASWMKLLKRAKVMGDEEMGLRRDLNSRYYIGTMTEIRMRVQAALTS